VTLHRPVLSEFQRVGCSRGSRETLSPDFTNESYGTKLLVMSSANYVYSSLEASFHALRKNTGSAQGEGKVKAEDVWY
jgi:hypothetical protein